MPVKELSRAADISPALRDYIANMVYVGVLAWLLHIDMDEIAHALNHHFRGKQKAVESNFSVAQAAYQWAGENLTKTDPYRVERMAPLDDYLMTDGNTAGALGSIFGGVQFVAWYPITPASTLPEALIEFLPQYRKDPLTGKNTYAVVQAEDELAAIGMIIGAGFGGLRSLTATSGPGLSLMTEYAGLAYFAEVPTVIWDVQRVGPSTGLPTRTAQSDMTMAHNLGHGDTRHVMLIPGSVTECFEFGWKAFDIAEHLQAPVFVMSDLDLGMNQWMTLKFEYPDTALDRGKVLWEDDLEKRNGSWGRYADVDGDDIPYRTVPGNLHINAAYMARGTGHDTQAHYSEDPQVWETNLNRLVSKYYKARDLVPQPILERTSGVSQGVISYGSSDPAVIEARDLLRQRGFNLDKLRVRALPFTAEVEDFLREHEVIYVVENNQDGQMAQLLSQEFPALAGKLVKVAHNDGLPLSATWIVKTILKEGE
jgi:2-oxoglutarate ferredoxin oxidoreductase subunit alpha